MNSTEIVGGTLRSDLRWDISAIPPPTTPARTPGTPLNSTLAPCGTPLRDMRIEVSAITAIGQPRENRSSTVNTMMVRFSGRQLIRLMSFSLAHFREQRLVDNTFGGAHRRCRYCRLVAHAVDRWAERVVK